ncbi:hypothetical protein BATDEDRAFT_24691 [Batrachochytrium dendrobatidis JAM81]|uniref:Radial spoke head protein 9 homolog n=1 Tax=Batrachochytrium dendrobatidis (strain JAM81 / FGSC 10211) TaxID=684364 RepID=F4P245_BATDJ|nr:uncharacterized protein BATDEDRAFT_24691 [Batrachochytrium dendrobatidis JAM81]EGF81050.1 hypothetical protein BATDEDRAFT_24691 [Batrachochytrium dendrobatidis JAM81]KAJ8329079.1 hypothetical protein O5D80_003028 [Batrachochytrium dendrobatidis]KAK5669025.1 hypothetical protein QVD99_004790 [Batrachochytrium dendrobatidis]|eukprot:XP_006678516.1 hypothetical protein BATDEDRAFT_24691 [Batrachochytrium dendrobatidis JAM81]
MSFMESQDAAMFNLAGFTLNIEERASLFNSLVIKKEQEKLPNIYLWGKVLGIQQDYLLAQSVSESLFDRKYYYTCDSNNWFQLPEITPEEAKLAELAHGRFYGDPSYEHTIPKDYSDPNSSETKLREEKRLTALMSIINYQAQIVPRGAYYRNLDHKIIKNPNFRGLDTEDMKNIDSFLHFRDGFEVTSRTLSERIEKFDDTIDIFESIGNDEPKGAWAVNAEQEGTATIVRSLQWPGYTFVHSTSPLSYASFYYGTGQKNHNIGFML